MEILDTFYSREYESNINRNMLQYSYTFPMEEVQDFVRRILLVPIEEFIKYDIEAETIETITSKDVFQFSSLEAGTVHICRILNDLGNPGVTFVQAGQLLLNDGKQRNTVAYIKYGENHLKTAESLGLLFELTHTYFVSCIGLVFLDLNEQDKNKLLIRLLLRNKLIARLVKTTAINSVDARQFFYMLSDTTYIRRKSNIKCILKCLQNSSEYDFSKIIERINFS